MAISPPSDIVLDVARAVEPSNLETARAELAKRGSAVGGSAVASFSLGETGISGSFKTGTEQAKTPDSFKRFEAMVLQTFIQNMLPKDAENVYGKGMAGDMWKSMMAGKIADVMAERGGIGIADRVLGDHYVDGKNKVAVGPVSGGPEKAETDKQTMLSTALVQELQRKMAKSLSEDQAAISAKTKI
ncbi:MULTISPECIES: rod-binding protein [unclassified Mesorhizobium]|uniref:rod-binding protein n=1 Tax=unclassified Mesorhizobium TaxID=325217 RepID=UPI0008ED1898|nr:MULTISPECIES: rod-binding protein [unclassified Mesorhizobium]RJG44072.1 flagellar biosynthesis protein FlgJ [Mesorhizobium sp. DCY119]SFU06122.1 Rod binding protein [Mesorhizobium sp. YR577]